MKRPGLSILLLVLGLFLAGTAQAGYWDDFKKARDAVEAGDWDGAEKLLRQAIADNPEPKKRALGARYIPYYYLGVVLQEKGDCPAALEAWATSDRYGIVKAASDESRDKERRKLRCEKQAAELEKASNELDRALSATRSALARLDGQTAAPAVAAAWKQGSPSLGKRRDDAEARLRKAEGLVQEARRLRDPERLRLVAREADAVTVVLEELFDEAEVLRGKAGEARAAASEELSEAVAEARQVLDRVAALAPYPEQLKKRIETLERRLRAAGSANGDAGTLETARRNLESAAQAVDEAAAPPPDALLDAAELYLAQDFAAAVARLEGLEERDDRVRFHAALLRAAAHFQLHGSTVGGDPSHLAAARDAVRVCHSLNAAAEFGRPSPRLYPPSFLEFYAAVGHGLDDEDPGDQADQGADQGPASGAADNGPEPNAPL